MEWGWAVVSCGVTAAHAPSDLIYYYYIIKSFKIIAEAFPQILVILKPSPHLHLWPLCLHYLYYRPHFTNSPPETWKTPLITKCWGMRPLTPAMSSATLCQGGGKVEPVKTCKRLLLPCDGAPGETKQTGCGCNSTVFPAWTPQAVQTLPLRGRLEAFKSKRTDSWVPPVSLRLLVGRLWR